MYPLRTFNEFELPDSDKAIARGLAFSDTIESCWTPKKEFKCGVQTYTNWIQNDEGRSDFWAARVSYHDNISYQDAFDTSSLYHTENESQYIGMVESFEPSDPHKDWSSRQVKYRFPFPLARRDMDIWLTQKETEEGVQFVNVTLPRKWVSPHTQGKYVSVEVCTLMPDGRLRWVMATTSDAGGWVPQFLQRPKMCEAVAEDVPQYLKWLQKRNQG